MTDFLSALIAAIVLALGAIGISGMPTEPLPTPAGMLPCATEDAPGPCIWIAPEQGNGEGRSFWVDSEQGVHFLD